MKRIYRYLLMAVLAICLSIPALAAEAASIALLPLINNVQGDEIANQIYFKSAINAINAQKGFMLVENDKLTAAIDAAKIAGKVPSKAVLEKIAKDGNVDIVIAMELDKLDDITLYSSEGNMLQLALDGKAVAAVYDNYKQWCEDSGERSPYARRTWTAKVKENVTFENGATLESKPARVDDSTRLVRVFGICNVRD